MQAYLLNTETRDRIDFQYMPLSVDLGGVESRYASADIPQRFDNPIYWQGGDRKPRTVQLLVDSSTAQYTYQGLESWAKPIPGKYAPPILLLQIGSLKPERCVLLEVSTTATLSSFLASEKPSRIIISTTLKPVTS